MGPSFQAQRGERDCYPICIKNVVDESYGRMRVPARPHPVALRDINKACGLQGKYRPSSLPLDTVRENLDDLVAAARAHAVHRQGAQSDWRLLGQITDDAESSFPVVTLAPAYFTDAAAPYQVRVEPSAFHHGLVVLHVDDDVLLFDPLAKRLQGEAGKYMVTLHAQGS